jgi:hypothetical protein
VFGNFDGKRRVLIMSEVDKTPCKDARSAQFFCFFLKKNRQAISRLMLVCTTDLFEMKILCNSRNKLTSRTNSMLMVQDKSYFAPALSYEKQKQ